MTLHSAWLRLRWLLRRHSGERELDEELRFHMEAQAEFLVRTGQSPDEAARRTRLEFGGLDQVKEQCRDARGSLLESIWSDVRYGLRTLGKTPVFTLTALASLALGIGANTALFTALDYAFWRPLAVRDPDRLYAFRSPGPNLRGAVGSDLTMAFPYPVYQNLRDHNTTLDGIVARFGSRTSVGWHARTQYMDVEFTSGNYFELLGVRPAAGRFFTEGEDREPGAHPVAVLSHAAWRLKFGGDPSIIGQTIRINRVPVVIIGISEKSFSGVMREDTEDIRVPLAMYEVLGQSWYKLGTHDMAWLHLVGRLKRSVSPRQAKAELDLTYRNILGAEAEQMGPNWPSRKEFLARQIELIHASRGVIWDAETTDRAGLALMGLVGCVLLIACANITSLLLARNMVRNRELAVRVAVGAGRVRIVRQLFTESLLLTAGGGAVGFGVAYLASPVLLKRFFGADVLYVYPGTPDLRVGLFTAAVCLCVALLTGLVPALRAAPGSFPTLLRSEHGATAANSHLRLRSALVIGEIALSVCLTAATWLVARTLHNLRTSDMGFRENGLVTFAINAALEGYPRQKADALYENLRRELSAAPGVAEVAMTDLGIMDHSGEGDTFEVQSRTDRLGEKAEVFMYQVSPGYFRVLGVPVLAGHEFERPREPGVLVNRTFAQRFFAGGNAVGAHIRRSGRKDWLEVAGVVADEKHFSYREDPTPYVYYVYKTSDDVSYYVKTAGNPAAVIEGIRAITGRLVPGVPVRGLNTLSQHIDDEMMAESAMSMLVTAFCILATLLTAVGVYGVTSYNVVRRTREMGIRMALGADRSRIVCGLFGQTARMIALGTAAGLAATVVLTRFVQSYVYGIDAADPISLAAATVTVAVTASVATLLPARRATRIDPMQALRLE